MSYLQSHLGTSFRIRILFAVILFLTIAAVNVVTSARALIAHRPALEFGYIKPWSTHPENRALFWSLAMISAVVGLLIADAAYTINRPYWSTPIIKETR